MPLAAHATLEKGVLAISAAWGDPHNSHAPLIQAKDHCEIDLNHPTVLQQASELGIRVAQQLIQKGAVAVIK